MSNLIRLVLTLLTVLGIAACNATSKGEDLVKEGAKHLSAAEARAHVSGNTEMWDEGPVYYAPDGTLQMDWHKVRSTGSWEVSDNGDVCLKVPTWKGCHYYLDLEGVIWTVDDKRINGNQLLVIKPGKHLRR